MAETRTITAQPRSGTGTGAARAVRREGRVPGILYGGKDKPEAISLDAKEIGAAVATGRFTSTLFELDLAGKKVKVLPKEVQLDPLYDMPVHVDLMRLAEGQRVRLFVPVRFKNHEASPGLKRGGVLNIVRHEVEFVCPSNAIPEFIEGDLSGLEINDGLHISAFALPQGVTPVIQGRDFTVATIVPSSGFVEDTRAPAAAATEAAPAAGAAAPAAGAAAAPAAGGDKKAAAPAKGGDKK